MASYVTPRKNTAFVFYVALEDQANAGLFKTAPTLAAGDFKVSIDGGALANLTDLPTVTPSGGRMVKVALTASEMDGDNITVVASDASGAEWYDLVVNIQTSAQQVDDLATAAALATVDGIVDALALVAPDNKPTVAITGEASANVTLWQGDAVAGAPALESTAQAIKLVTDTLDVTAVTQVAASSAGHLTITAGLTFNEAVTGLTIPIDWETALWTLKYSPEQADTAAVIQLRATNPTALTDGLQRINGAAPSAPITASDGVLLVTQASGRIGVLLSDELTALLSRATGLGWDVKFLDASGDSTGRRGTADIVLTETRALA